MFDPRWPSLLREPLLVARTYLLEASGHPDQGQLLMEELVALMRGWGDPHKLASAQQQLAGSLFVQGKAAEAVAVRREVAAGFGAARSISAGWNLMNLSAALTYQGEVEAALQAARESLPLLRLAGRLAGHFDHWALLACQRRRFSAAARALGRVDALFASSGFGRELSERRARDMAYARLQQALPGAELERLMAQGAAWPDDEALAAEMLS